MNSLVEKVLSSRPPLGEMPDWLRKRVNDSVASCQSMALPDRKNEDWKYTNPKKFLHDAYDIPKPGKLKDESIVNDHLAKEDVNLVFLNGHFQTDSSSIQSLPKGLKIRVLNESYDSLEDVMADPKGHLNIFQALNDALTDQGLVIEVEKNAVIDPVIHLLFLYSSNEKASFLAAPKILLKTGSSSSATVRESHIGSQGTFFSNIASEIEVGANSQLRHYKLVKLNSDSVFVDHSSVLQKRDSSFETLNLSLGGRLIRNDLRIDLSEPGSFAQFDGVYSPKGSEHVDNQTVVDHSSPNCQSSQLYKGTLSDSSRAVFNGKVLIRKDSQQTDAKQLNNNLLLSDKVEIDTKPMMEIDADDVKCAHGATVGRMDEEELFYLQSRGIPLEQSRQMLALGFLNEPVQRMSHAAVKSKFEAILREEAL